MKSEKYQEAKEALEEIVKILKKEDFVECISVIGSFSTEHFDEYSDIDTIIFTNKVVRINEVKNALRNIISEKDILFEYKSKSSYHLDVYIGGIKIMLFFRQKGKIFSELKKHNKISKYDFYKQKDIMIFKKSNVLYDKTGSFKRLLKNIKTYPEGMKEFLLFERCHKLNYYLFIEGGEINILRKREQFIEASNSITDVVFKMYEIIYALNNEFLTDRKWALKEIESFEKKPKMFVRNLKKIYSLSNSKKNFDKKIEILRKISIKLNELTKKEGVKDLPEMKLTKK